MKSRYHVPYRDWTIEVNTWLSHQPGKKTLGRYYELTHEKRVEGRESSRKLKVLSLGQ